MTRQNKCFILIFSNLCVHVFPGSNFVTRKISRSVAKIHLGQLQCFSLGNLDSKRDWGHAKDYVEVLEYTHIFWFNSVEDVHIHINCFLPWYMVYQPIATLSLWQWMLHWNFSPVFCLKCQTSFRTLKHLPQSWFRITLIYTNQLF